MENNIINNNMEYTVDYFIKKFEAIPGRKFITGEISNNLPGESESRCAMGWCMDENLKNTSESDAFVQLFHSNGIAGYRVNNGEYQDYQQSTPKQRILAALYDIKAIIEEGEDKEKRMKEGKEILERMVEEEVEEIIINNIINEKVLEEVL